MYCVVSIETSYFLDCRINSLTRQGAELTRKGAELIRAEETIRRELQQNQEMRQRVGLVCVELCVL